MSSHGVIRRVSKIGVSPSVFQCSYCGKIDDPDSLVNSKDCTQVYEPCSYCGQVEECAKDCSGITGILGSNKVYATGFDEKTNEFYNDHDSKGKVQ